MDYRKELVTLVHEITRIDELKEAGQPHCIVCDQENKVHDIAIILKQRLRVEKTKCEIDKCE